MITRDQLVEGLQEFVRLRWSKPDAPAIKVMVDSTDETCVLRFGKVYNCGTRRLYSTDILQQMIDELLSDVEYFKKHADRVEVVYYEIGIKEIFVNTSPGVSRDPLIRYYKLSLDRDHYATTL